MVVEKGGRVYVIYYLCVENVKRHGVTQWDHTRGQWRLGEPGEREEVLGRGHGGWRQKVLGRGQLKTTLKRPQEFDLKPRPVPQTQGEDHCH